MFWYQNRSDPINGRCILVLLQFLARITVMYSCTTRVVLVVPVKPIKTQSKYMQLTHSVPVSHWTSGFGLFTSIEMNKLYEFKTIMWCSNAKQIDLWHQENTRLLIGHVISSKNMYLWGAVHGINNHCYSICRLILSLSAMRKIRKLVSTMPNSSHVKVLYWVLFCLCFFGVCWD